MFYHVKSRFIFMKRLTLSVWFKQTYDIYIEIVIVAPNKKQMQLSAILNTNKMAQFSIQLCI